MNTRDIVAGSAALVAYAGVKYVTAGEPVSGRDLAIFGGLTAIAAYASGVGGGGGEDKNAKAVSAVSQQPKPLTVVCPMCGDFLHPGHIRLLQAAAEHGNVTVWLMTDSAMQSYKRKPYFTFKDREMIIRSLACVHDVVPFDMHPDNYGVKVLREKPDVFCHGTDWRTNVQSKGRQGVIAAVAEYGGRLLEPEYTRNISSSMIHESMSASPARPIKSTEP